MQDELQTLTTEHGILSRKIGQAKRAGEPVDELVAQVSALSQQINSIKNQLAESDEEKHSSSASSNSKNAQADQATQESVHALFVPNSHVVNNASVCEGDVIQLAGANEDDAQDWDEYVLNRADASTYHYWSIRESLAGSFAHPCHYFIARYQNGKVCGVLPSVELSSPLFGHFIVSMPYFTYGGVLADSASIEQTLIQALLEKAKTLGVSHVEIRKQSQALDLLPSLKEKQSKVSMVCALPNNKQQFWSDAGSKVRAQVKKAKRFNLETCFGRLELIDDFYTVFATNMRDLGTPVYAKSFFENLLYSDSKNRYSISVTYDAKKPVAACFLMGNKSIREIPWASSLRSAASKNANMAMYAAVLDDTIDQAYTHFDFGRSSPDAGTYRFKKQWGAKPMPLYWYYWLRDGGDLPELNPNNPKYKLLIKVWQRLPVWLTKLIGPPVVKYLP